MATGLLLLGAEADEAPQEDSTCKTVVAGERASADASGFACASVYELLQHPRDFAAPAEVASKRQRTAGAQTLVTRVILDRPRVATRGTL